MNSERVKQLLNLISVTPEGRRSIFGTKIAVMVEHCSVESGCTIDTAVGVVVVGLFHAARRHPEWLQAVCEDQKDMLQNEPNIEDALKNMIEMYPIARRELDDAGGN